MLFKNQLEFEIHFIKLPRKKLISLTINNAYLEVFNFKITNERYTLNKYSLNI